jgi:uncharacterized protein (DUF342 family)
MSKIKEKNIQVKISSDGCKAHISIKQDPACPNLSLVELSEILKDHGVVYGVQKEVAMIIVGKYRQGADINNILVAEGVEPFEGVQPAVNYKFEISSKPKETESGKVDYREIQRILNVKEGQLLAVKRKMKPPRTGIMVTGQKTTFEPILDIPVLVADNIVKEDTEDETRYKAACAGALKFENQVLSVFPTLDIKQDVDFNVGNIYFKGDVKIGRDVLPDFIVEAHGSICLWGSAIACKLKALEGIEVRAGIVGKNKGFVHSGTDISATFVENATLEANGDVMVKNGIIGTTVRCNGHLTVDMKRSRIVGSTVKAAKGILACNIGSRFDTGTVLITGIYPDKEQDYVKIKQNLDAKWNEAKELEKRYGRSTLENKNFSRAFSDTIRQDSKRYDVLKQQIKTILQHLKKAEEAMYDYEAVIRVKETLYPRVQLQIGKHKLTTSKEYYNVTAHYSEEESKIIIK